MKPPLPGGSLQERNPQINTLPPEMAPMNPIITVAELPLVEAKAQVWNTKNLGLRTASDAFSGFAAAVVVSPIVTAVDKAIMQNASGQATLKESVKASIATLALRPQVLVFSKPFALVCMLYGGTYFTANSVDTVSAMVKNRPASSITSGTAKFAASSGANVGLCLIKDQAFVRMFGSGGPPRPVSLPSYALFTIRDCLTIFASFNVPPLLGPVISKSMGKELEKSLSGQTVAQFLAPASVQLFSTPIHLVGLDIYNREGKLGWSDRWQMMKKNWGISVAARICRIVPAFGIGGVVNQNLRKGLMKRLE